MAKPFDGAVISDMLQLAEFASWLCKSSREQACVLVSQKQNGKPALPIDRIRKAVGTGHAGPYRDFILSESCETPASRSPRRKTQPSHMQRCQHR